jgi:hypothetical protein
MIADIFHKIFHEMNYLSNRILHISKEWFLVPQFYISNMIYFLSLTTWPLHITDPQSFNDKVLIYLNARLIIDCFLRNIVEALLVGFHWGRICWLIRNPVIAPLNRKILPVYCFYLLEKKKSRLFRGIKTVWVPFNFHLIGSPQFDVQWQYHPFSVPEIIFYSEL